jgi:galactokinase
MDPAKLTKIFAEKFGDSKNTSCYFAPGRVNLIGEHTDYNGGHVFPCALTIGTYCVARKRGDKKILFYSENFKEKGVVECSLDELKNHKEYDWANYPLGVVWALNTQKKITLPVGFEMCVWGNIPAGAGLSSSASIEVLTGVMLRDLYDLKNLDNVAIALNGQYSENNFNGCNCGIMDQFISAMGKKDNAVFLDTNTLKFEYAKIALPDAKIVIVNSNVPHSLVTSEYNNRRNDCNTALKELQSVCKIKTLGDLTEAEFEKHKSAIKDAERCKKAKHAVYENQRTIKAIEALKKNDIKEFGKLMNASHVSLRDDYKVSCKEVDFLVDFAWKFEGVIGARITGGGFGGCTVQIVKNEAVEKFKKEIVPAYKKATNLNCEVYVVDIGDGARKLN